MNKGMLPFKVALMTAVSSIGAVEVALAEGIQTIPNDPLFHEQWNLDHYSAENINILPAWRLTTGSRDVTLGILDSGLLDHPDAPKNIVGGMDFIFDLEDSRDGDRWDAYPRDEGDWREAGECKYQPRAQKSTWHGLRTLGIVAAPLNNSEGMAGIAPDVNVSMVRISSKCGGLPPNGVQTALEWVGGISVPSTPINHSPAKAVYVGIAGEKACPERVQDAINMLRSRNITVVAAAGNRGKDVSTSYPASCEGVITVAAVNSEGAKSFYSNYGSGVTLSAPSSGPRANQRNDLISTSNDSLTRPSEGQPFYDTFGGTSGAAPQVLGTIGLMLSVNPFLTTDEIKYILTSTAQQFDLGSGSELVCDTQTCGAGVLDAGAAVAAADLGVPQGVMPTGVTMRPETRLSSPNGQYQLVFQFDGNLVLYRGSSAVWNAGTYAPVPSYKPELKLESGNLILRIGSTVLWQSNTRGSGANRMEVSDSGQVLLTRGGVPIWASN